MFNPDLFTPVLAHVALVFLLGGMTAAARMRAVASGATRGRELRTGQQNWPGWSQQVSSAFNNQFETPTYFLAAAAFAMIADVSEPLIVTLAWIYVASRYVHALVYVSINIVPIRFLVFIVGLLSMFAMWGLVAWRVLGGA